MLAALEAHGRSLFGLGEPVNGESSQQGAARLSGSSSEEEESSDAEDHEREDLNSDDEVFDKGEDGHTKGRLRTTVPETVFAEGGRSGEVISKTERRAFMVSPAAILVWEQAYRGQTGNSSKMLGIRPEEALNRSGKKRRRAEDGEDEDGQ